MRRRPTHRLFAELLVASVMAGCSAGSSKDALAGDGGGADASFALDSAPGDAAFDPDAACAAKSYSGKKLPLVLAIVFDQSSSMSDGSPAKIEVAKAGLKKAFSDRRFDDVAVGLFRFGYQSGADGCIWDTEPTAAPQPLSSSRAILLSEIDKLTPSGATPTYSALNAAYGWLSPKIYARTPPEDGRVAVVLVTDGAPTCSAETIDDYVALVKKARKATIDTFAIGLPGSDERFDGTSSSSPSAAAFLSKLAGNGTDLENLPAGCAADPVPITAPPAKPCYFDFHSSFSEDALAAAFENIRKSVSSCVFAMPSPEPALDSARPTVVVTSGGGAAKELPRCVSTTAFGPDGCWDFANAARTQVRIFGAACAGAKADDAAKVDLLLPCKVK